MAKSPALLKRELEVQVGNRLTNLPRMVSTAKSAVIDGIPANESQGTPALTATEVRALLDAPTLAFIQALPNPS
jgi:hypothetical protein